MNVLNTSGPVSFAGTAVITPERCADALKTARREQLHQVRQSVPLVGVLAVEDFSRIAGCVLSLTELPCTLAERLGVHPGQMQAWTYWRNDADIDRDEAGEELFDLRSMAEAMLNVLADELLPAE